MNEKEVLNYCLQVIKEEKENADMGDHWSLAKIELAEEIIKIIKQ